MTHSAFDVHLLNDEGKQKAVEIAEAFDGLLTRLKEIIPLREMANGAREMAVTTTKLEEACFFAKKAMALQIENQQWDSPLKAMAK